MRMLLTLAGIAAGFYLVVSAIFFGSQSSLLFLPEVPTRALDYTPAALEMKYEDVQLQTSDGETLHGWYVPAVEPTERTVLLFHGNAGNISHRLDTLRIWQYFGFNSFIFDYRGYGNSTGEPSEEGTRLDAEAAWRYLVEQRGTPPQEIVLKGRSLGGAIAVRLASEVEPRALIVESSFTSVPDVAADLYPWLPVRLLATLEFDSLQRMPSVDCPVMIVHSQDDRTIPFHHGRQLYEAVESVKYMLVLQGDHNETYRESRRTYIDGLADFLDTLPDG